MTTEVYAYDYFGNKEQCGAENDWEVEVEWLIKEIIKPDLPNIIDNFSMCLEMLQSEQEFVMPLSNGKEESKNSGSPIVKGIMVRQGEFIIDFQVMMSFGQFKKGKQIVAKMKPSQKYLLVQFSTTIMKLKDILIKLQNLQMIEDIEEFYNVLESALEELNDCIDTLQNPPHGLTFPGNNNGPIKQMFDDYDNLFESTHHQIALDITIFRNELCVEFKNLTKVTRPPWDQVDLRTGKCFAEKIKEELKEKRNMNLEQVLQSHGLQINQPSLLGNIVSRLSSESVTLPEAQDYLRRSVSFDKRVVMEIEKASLTTSDPSLISISSKLQGLKTCINNHLSNLSAHK
ncbi:uncharacterized protein GVI51_F05071 [Nakaseomyces glabratus]|uniref:Regulator of V-ATPase in vacuolar membrane protein 2 n=2 Tax=Candida glabrata TaxID=5478 RepID=Q6FU87_CANGA|nr:uncharacterized protein CAGL0F05445g [Nakaseomyces glabratus]KAH7587697.1 Rogdi leucine zipper containing protein [Nakaseomyces glabratus]KAH7589511.1 Rogdi leucine zipper containing protein [Nakaseomyces glabratus]KAH7594682.1 Rogdi leucine zipper containing protein [Nakaseomyces glabratus]KAH7604180.1 Rogdi leucine zipper containing protein [Nakaseomyces glabratus]KAH7605166.1 Rogdi leucine zipper containing protein [Nakaseomyces glabratus]|eukprot:XP_446207.1 uncharacterized protein CAGL0F05445g [[Candida] glabrata]